MSYQHYYLLAELFRYPTTGFKEKLDDFKNEIITLFPDSYSFITDFNNCIKELSIHQSEEYYVNTFLIQPISSMDIGFVLFGDDQKRNDFLVKIQGEQKNVQNDCGIELPDHLPNILTLIPKLLSEELRIELAFCLLLPAIKEIDNKFKDSDNYYKYAFKLLHYILEKDFENCTLDQFVITKKTNTANLIKNNCVQ